jgi:hypothetical protein
MVEREEMEAQGRSPWPKKNGVEVGYLRKKNH